jgi:trehalose 6-phosphate phosphatase
MHHSETLEHLLSAQPLALATDFDGTISKIAPSPELAVVDPRCRELLASLAATLPLVAVISGRPVAEVRRLVGLPELVYVGSHGLERWQSGVVLQEPSALGHVETIRSILQEARRRLKLPGLVFEEKVTGASIHYRRTSDVSAARREVTSVLQELTADTELKVLEGRRVVELRPPLEANKGTVLCDLLLSHRVTGAIYAGDDTTDLDAFAGIRRWALRAGGTAVAVAVTSKEMPAQLRERADLVVDGVQGWADVMEIVLRGSDAPTRE